MWEIKRVKRQTTHILWFYIVHWVYITHKNENWSVQIFVISVHTWFKKNLKSTSTGPLNSGYKAWTDGHGLSDTLVSPGSYRVTHHHRCYEVCASIIHKLAFVRCLVRIPGRDTCYCDWTFFVFFSVPPRKWRKVTMFNLRPFPSKFFSIHQSSYYSTTTIQIVKEL
jgi:hypothetical protein